MGFISNNCHKLVFPVISRQYNFQLHSFCVEMNPNSKMLTNHKLTTFYYMRNSWLQILVVVLPLTVVSGRERKSHQFFLKRQLSLLVELFLLYSSSSQTPVRTGTIWRCCYYITLSISNQQASRFTLWSVITQLLNRHCPVQQPLHICAAEHLKCGQMWLKQKFKCI